MRSVEHAASMPCRRRFATSSNRWLIPDGRAYDEISASVFTEAMMIRWIAAAAVAMMVTPAQVASSQDFNELRKLYYAGLAYSKIKRVDMMASHFDSFLKLAPQSPQRPEVQSIMRTLGK